MDVDLNEIEGLLAKATPGEALARIKALHGRTPKAASSDMAEASRIATATLAKIKAQEEV